MEGIRELLKQAAPLADAAETYKIKSLDEIRKDANVTERCLQKFSGSKFSGTEDAYLVLQDWSSHKLTSYVVGAGG